MIKTDMTVCTRKNEFRRKLLSERIHYRAPFCNVIMNARIKGSIPVESLNDALDKACTRHPLLRARIEMDEGGNAWFTSRDCQELRVKVVNKKSDRDWIEKAKDEYKIPFCLDRGPLIRFILLESPDSSDFLVICHHTICDGMSLVYLIRDIMTFLGNPSMEAEPLPAPPVFDMDCFPGSPGIGLLPKLVLGHFNNAWKKCKKVFNEEDYRDIYKNFWSKEKLEIISYTIEKDRMSSLASCCRKEGVTVNSAVCTAFITAQNRVQGQKHPYSGKTGVAVNMRNRMAGSPGEGMGLFAGGTAIQLKNKPEKTFWETAREFDKEIKKLLSGGHKLYEILLFNMLEQTLIDAVFFHLFGGFENKTAAAFTRLIHFDKKRPGWGTTNLGKVDIPLTYGPYELESLFFAPSNIPGGEKMLGVVTAGGRMNLSLVYLQSAVDTGIVMEIKDCAAECLEKAMNNCRNCADVRI